MDKINHALILAAGLGTRLSPITDNIPKSLVQVNGTPILFKQIENLLSNGIENITIVSGYKASVLAEKVYEKYPQIQIVESVDYATTNNMYSAYLCREILEGKSFLMMNADVFFDSSVISSLIAFEASNAIVTDIGTYLEESMKVTEKNGIIAKISKQIPEECSLGSSIDVYKFSSIAGNHFFNKCAEYIENFKELKLWSEIALNDILCKVDFKACPLTGRWLEIDNHDDLAAAESLFND